MRKMEDFQLQPRGRQPGNRFADSQHVPNEELPRTFLVFDIARMWRYGDRTPPEARTNMIEFGLKSTEWASENTGQELC